MTDTEKTAVVAAIEGLRKNLVDTFLPQLIAAEEAKLPATYGGIVSMILTPLVPQLTAFLDAEIAAVEGAL